MTSSRVTGKESMSKYFTFINEIQMTGHVSHSLSTRRKKMREKQKQIVSGF
jgi:hypothetical protein